MAGYVSPFVMILPLLPSADTSSYRTVQKTLLDAILVDFKTAANVRGTRSMSIGYASISALPAWNAYGDFLQLGLQLVYSFRRYEN